LSPRNIEESVSTPDNDAAWGPSMYFSSQESVIALHQQRMTEAMQQQQQMKSYAQQVKYPGRFEVGKDCQDDLGNTQGSDFMRHSPIPPVASVKPSNLEIRPTTYPENLSQYGFGEQSDASFSEHESSFETNSRPEYPQKGQYYGYDKGGYEKGNYSQGKGQQNGNWYNGKNGGYNSWNEGGNDWNYEGGWGGKYNGHNYGGKGGYHHKQNQYWNEYQSSNRSESDYGGSNPGAGESLQYNHSKKQINHHQQQRLAHGQNKYSTCAAPNPEEERSTVMVRNIPRKATQRMLLHELDQAGFYKQYDFLYLPFCFETKANVGYAFINFLDGYIAERFLYFWNSNKNSELNIPQPSGTKRPLAAVYADVQGLQANLDRLVGDYKISRIHNPRYQPSIFKNGVPIHFKQYIEEMGIKPAVPLKKKSNTADKSATSTPSPGPSEPEHNV